MRELLECVAKLENRQEAVVYTVIDGKDFSRKVLMIDGHIVWPKTEEGFLKEHESDLAEMSKPGIYVLDGRQIFADRLGSETKLVICGAGHVSMPIIRLGKMLGFEVTVIEDRPYFAGNARKEDPACVLCEPFSEALDKIPGDKDTCFVIVTRGHRYDEECLQKIVKKDAAYIGMMGSRRRVAAVKQHALEQGADPEVVAELHAPIGLDIDAETPEEIAVSILAQIIAVRNKKSKTLGFPKEILRAVTGPQTCPGDKVLATIIRRKGSAPRSIGTKMLVHGDGTCTGTIGGGCMEASVRQKALWLLRDEKRDAMICTADLCADEAEKEGMVCGGVIDVLLEKIHC